MSVNQSSPSFRHGDQVTAAVARPRLAGIAMTSSGKTFLDVDAGDIGVVHQVGADGTLWVRLERPLAEAGSLWPFRPEQLHHAGARPPGPATPEAAAGG